MRAILISVTVALAGCSIAAPEKAAAPKPGTSFAFTANTDAEFQEAHQRATEWCAETYSEPAMLLDSRSDSAGTIVRFSCVSLMR